MRPPAGWRISSISSGAFKCGDVGRMTEANIPKLRAANELIASTVAGATR